MTSPNEHDSLVLDSTKLQTFCACPRKYFFNYDLNWVQDSPSIHLEFGVAWHAALEYLYRHGITMANIPAAYQEFITHYRKHFRPETDSIYTKNPQKAQLALISYVERYEHLQEGWEVLQLETAGRCTLAPDVHQVYKMDAVVKKPDGTIWVIDHKTASKHTSSLDDSWNTSIQMWTYLHAAREMYGDAVAGVIIDVSVFLKKDVDHYRLTVQRTPAQMKSLYWSVLTHIDMLRWNISQLKSCSAEDEMMCAFPMNPTACTMFGRCPYLDLCMAWNNPLGRGVPSGYIVKVWNPLEGANH